MGLGDVNMEDKNFIPCRFGDWIEVVELSDKRITMNVNYITDFCPGDVDGICWVYIGVFDGNSQSRVGLKISYEDLRRIVVGV